MVLVQDEPTVPRRLHLDTHAVRRPLDDARGAGSLLEVCLATVSRRVFAPACGGPEIAGNLVSMNGPKSGSHGWVDGAPGGEERRLSTRAEAKSIVTRERVDLLKRRGTLDGHRGDGKPFPKRARAVA